MANTSHKSELATGVFNVVSTGFLAALLGLLFCSSLWVLVALTIGLPLAAMLGWHALPNDRGWRSACLVPVFICAYWCLGQYVIAAGIEFDHVRAAEAFAELPECGEQEWIDPPPSRFSLRFRSVSCTDGEPTLHYLPQYGLRCRINDEGRSCYWM